MLNNSRFLLAIILVLGVLLVVEEWRWHRLPAGPQVPLATQTAPPPPASTPPPITAARPEQAVPKPKALTWADIESTDYHVYIANLRKLGCPEQTIRDIITADVNALYAKRRKELVVAPGGIEYWRAANNFAETVGKPLTDACMALDEERRRVLRELLAIEVPADVARTKLTKSELNEAALDFLPESKKAQVLAALNSSDERFQTEISGAKLSPEERRAAFNQWKADRNAQVTANLTPAEQEEYDVRFSYTASWVRSRLGAANLSADQFRQLVLSGRPSDEAMDPRIIDPGDAEAVARGKAAQDALLKKFQQVTGTDPATIMPDPALARRYGSIPGNETLTCF